MGIPKTMTALISGCVLAASATGVALAQDMNTMAPAEPQMMAPATDFDQDQIDAFAVAYVQVMEIGIQSDQQLQAAATDEERMGVQMQAQEQMITAVEGIEGITVDDYNAILTATQSDPELAGQVQEAVDAAITQDN